eukprot:TRINITY_DN3035_c0_g1_i2.p1 TRINITY_DN3035_c0_g1~~TRINITY_DN3035_c0_g1_i2.p1  ORF type:complete len:602 (-),score=97.05 TRINITY_DN3035_c0_g1_i2:1617-3185(-)
MLEAWKATLLARGRDAFQCCHIKVSSDVTVSQELPECIQDREITMLSSVLHLRGRTPSPQPFLDTSNNALQWNGEVFGGFEEVALMGSDTALLSAKLGECKSQQEILKTVAQVEGPFAFSYWHHATNSLYFGRDAKGRRSLVISYQQRNFFLSSVPIPHSEMYGISWAELEPKGIYCLQYGPEGNAKLTLHPWGDILPSRVLPLQLSECWEDRAKQLYDVLFEAIKKRTVFRPLVDESSDEIPLAILFSGGVDSSIIAAMCGLILPKNVPIDLINVAFMEGHLDDQNKLVDIVPDRASGVLSFEDLRRIQPDRIWNFISVNVPPSELREVRGHITDLMNPAKTLMDITIASALWFASRGEGRLSSWNPFVSPELITLESYTSRAKILMVGHGADEQLAGYARHRTAARKGGWNRLIEELQKDMNRLWRRNLGRDDRILSDHQREARHPFLDEDFTHFVSLMHPSQFCDFELPLGQGEKKLLRMVASLLGLKSSQHLPKRAIQFGSRISWQFPKVKGTDTDWS